MLGVLLSVSLAPLLVLLAPRKLSLFLLLVCIHFFVSLSILFGTTGRAALCLSRSLACSTRLSCVLYSVCWCIIDYSLYTALQNYNQLSALFSPAILQPTILCALLCLAIIQPTIYSTLPADLSTDYSLCSLWHFPTDYAVRSTLFTDTTTDYPLCFAFRYMTSDYPLSSAWRYDN
jgi:hypothetical protein